MSSQLKFTLRLGILFSIFLFNSPLAHAGPPPEVALKNMLTLAESGNWERYVDEYYGEQHKFRSPKDRDKLVARYKNKWGKRVIPGLREASRVKPNISPDGKKAIFKLKSGDFILYKNGQGKWTFHL